MGEGLEEREDGLGVEAWTRDTGNFGGQADSRLFH